MKFFNLKWFIPCLCLLVFGCTQKIANLNPAKESMEGNNLEVNWNKADSILTLMTLSEKLG